MEGDPHPDSEHSEVQLSFDFSQRKFQSDNGSKWKLLAFPVQLQNGAGSLLLGGGPLGHLAVVRKAGGSSGGFHNTALCAPSISNTQSVSLPDF